jgi:hypothetical protein
MAFSAGDDPKDYNADEVVEYLNGDDVSDEEKQRVANLEKDEANGGKNRSTVLSAAEVDSDSSDSNDGDNDATSRDGDPSGTENVATSTESTKLSPENDPGNPASGDDYDPFVDKKVPSSWVAEQIAVERAGSDSNDSPTLDAVHADDDKSDDE